jgi:hypothetical protein
VELAARSEYLARRASAPIGLGTPRYAVGPGPGRAGCSHGGLGRSQLSDRSRPLFEPGSPMQFCPVQPSRRPQPDGASRGLSLPSAHARLSGPPIAGIPSAAMFRLQGLATLLAACSRRARAGFVSRRRRSWDSPFGAFSSRKVSGAFPPGCTHMPFLHPVHQPPKRRAGPGGRGFWASALPGVPGPATGD